MTYFVTLHEFTHWFDGWTAPVAADLVGTTYVADFGYGDQPVELGPLLPPLQGPEQFDTGPAF